MEADKLSIVIKRGGNWSQKLFQQLSSSVEHVKVSVEGPYGPTSSHLLRSVKSIYGGLHMTLN
jgi:ferric-chelate reductase